MKNYDVIVIGAGHAGCEAALACARMGVRTLIIAMSRDRICHISCNPSIGGLGKGQLVKEIDALGGQMAKAADATGIHFRILNKSRGPAVWSSRAQIDSSSYSGYMRDIILSQINLDLIEDEAYEIIVKSKRVCAVKTRSGSVIKTRSVVLTPGTFLNGLIHVGLEHRPGGRYDEPASVELSHALRRLGLEMSTLKTGTTPRIKRDSIDFSKLTAQPGDEEPSPFSFSTKRRLENRIACHMAYTNTKTHQIIKDNLDRSPLYTGIIRSTGVRYCPSIEDKVVRFPERQRHQVFLEPEGIDTDWYYPNGLATSLPVDAQEDMLHSIEGLENASIIRPGYGIEYEFIDPTQLLPNLETKEIKGLFTAGQINGTTGYEEAAGQGLIAGINAALKVKNIEPFVLGRATSYIGVLIDDLITKGTNEPYRMFTSRVEYRLLIREDNADIRLRRYGYDLGLISRQELDEAQVKSRKIDEMIGRMNTTRVKPTSAINSLLSDRGTQLDKVVTVAELLRRPQVRYEDIKEMGIISECLPEEYEKIIELLVKYEGFIKRQIADVSKMQQIDRIKIPAGIDLSVVSGLSREIAEKLHRVRPLSLGQASRISGVTPAAIILLMVYLKKYASQNIADKSCPNRLDI